MVNLVDDWQVLEELVGERLGFYQLLSVDGAIEIRVLFGKVGFEREFKDGNDKLLSQILDFCRKHRFIQIGAYVQDENFFRQEVKA